ncbi:MAG: reverse transcriptase domain-containing protein, partial [Polaromonas sp.]
CGPIQNHYISSIIDVHSAKVALSILQHKSDTAAQVKQWDITAKTQTGKPLRRFHTDGGTEYLPLKKYFNEQGTIMTTTTRDTPQHNGMAERMNRTILEKARSLLHHAHLPMLFWKEAVMTAVYIINRCVPSTGNRTITPEESWTGNKPSIKHMRVFGCNAYRHMMKKYRNNKLAPVVRPGIFIGYDEVQVGYYIVWDIEDKKPYRTRDVTFDETSFTFGRSQANLQTHSSTNKDDENTSLVLLELIYNNIHTDQDHIESKIANDTTSAVVVVNDILPAASEHDNGLVNVNEELEEGEVPRYWSRPQHGARVLEPDPIGNSDASQKQIQQAIAREMDEHIEAEVQPQLQPQIEVQLRRSQRHQQPRDYYAPIINYNKDEEMGLAVFVAKLEQERPPRSFWHAIKSKMEHKWRQAMNVEISALDENKTWILKSLPPGRQAIDSMWLYDYKYDANGNIVRYKARLVAKGYSQLEGIDYHETFAPVMKYKSLRIILALVVIMDLELVQMDVVTAFLHAEIKEQVYMKQPQGYEQGNNLVCLLLKALYGTKQAPHDWNEVLNSFMLSIGFKRCVSDSCVYVRTTKTNRVIIIGLFVDDLPIAYHKQDEGEWLELKSKFMSRFKMKDLGECKLILGMRVTRNRSNRTLKLDNQVKIEQLLSIGERTKWSPVPTPESTIKLQATSEEEQGLVDIHLYKSIVGSLNYLVQATRPDIAHAVNVVGRYASNPGPAHMMAVKRILRYLAGTAHQGLLYSGGDYGVTSQPLEITTWTDADWGGDLGDRKSTTGYLVKVNQCPVTWATKKQPTVALSTAEAEYMGIGCGVQEALWICQLLREVLGHERVRTPSTILCDNQAVLAITKDDKHHQRTKHIDIKHHFVRDHVKNNDIIIKWISTQQQQADLFTKGLGKIKFNKFKNEIMCDG